LFSRGRTHQTSFKKLTAVQHKNMINKKFNIWLPLLLSATTIIGMFMGYRMRDSMPGRKFFSTEKRSTLQEITDLLNTRYVDEVSIKSLTDTAIQAILSKLDPHSVFIPAKDIEQINDEIKGSFYGIGIAFSIIDDSLNVIQIVENGPSEKAGLQTGDIILKAGDSALSGKKISTERIRNILRGPQQSKIKLTILRSGKTITTEVDRGTIPIASLDAYYMLDSTTGYIKLNKFSSETYKEFMNALLSLKKLNMQKLVLDLRGNGGGVLDEATEIADELLPGDKLITYTEGLHHPKKEYRCRREGQFEKGKVIVLADEGSASASEVLMGALQDWDRATIVGRRSFGKGLVQEQYDLSDRSALRLTVARYYTPIGRSIQRPYKKGKDSYYADITKRFSDGEMITADSVKNDTSKLYKSQAGKKLFGGGGISPDYFVAADTGRIGNISAKIYTKGTLDDFGYKYFKQHKEVLLQYKTAPQFIKTFTLSNNDWKYFETMATKDSIQINNITGKEKTFIQGVLKSAIARQLFKSEGYFEAINIDDTYIKKAMEVIK
jgi:carboxyl-terminal processing protease